MHILKDSEYIIDWDRIEQARNVREFDAAYIVPMFGYQTVEEYYNGLQSCPYTHLRSCLF